MAVVCPGCGREYDVTLFPFGRTLTCTCGTRVGLGEPFPVARPAGAPRFIADAMLGRLARWLRTLGFDTAFDDAIGDEDLVRRAVREGRVILTRDRRLVEEWRVEGCLLVESEGTEEQLREVVEAMGLDAPARLFGRCRVCNTPLEPATAEAVEGRVPSGVLDRHDRFLSCSGCGRAYWEGSHAERMRRVVARVFGSG